MKKNDRPSLALGEPPGALKNRIERVPKGWFLLFLLMHVAVRSDGSVERIRVVRSSGHKLLDDAAVRIVRLSAPFAPFPPEIRKQVDVLDITRTWQFLDSGTLFSSK